MTKPLVAALVAALLLSACGGGTTPKSTADKVTLVPPNSSTKAATLSYLKSDGALVPTFRERSQRLARMSRSQDVTDREAVCRQVAASLNPVSPSVLYDQAVDIPDDVLRELALDYRRTVSDALVACGKHKQRVMDEALASLWAVETLFARRMAQLTS